MKILIIGATGLVGKEILKQALKATEVNSVSVFVRRSTGLTDPKLTEHLIDFDHIENWKQKICGDVLFCAMGTTKSAAGSNEAQYRVDFEYQYKVAEAARVNGVQKLVLISSTGARAQSPFFYLKTKGELEEGIRKLGFKRLSILRPSLLEGDREIIRSGEKWSHFFLSKIPRIKTFANMIPVKASVVAQRALKEGLQEQTGEFTLEAVHLNF